VATIRLELEDLPADFVRLEGPSDQATVALALSVAEQILAELSSAEVTNFSIYGKPGSGRTKYDVLVAHFVFSLSPADILVFDNAGQNADVFCQSALYCEVITPAPDVGEAATYVDMFSGVNIKALLFRRSYIGQAVAVITFGGYLPSEAAALMEEVGRTMDNKVIEALE
jgi:hypothetical protein